MLSSSLAHSRVPDVSLEAVSLLLGLPESRDRICLHSTSPIPCFGGIGYVVVVVVVVMFVFWGNHHFSCSSTRSNAQIIRELNLTYNLIACILAGQPHLHGGCSHGRDSVMPPRLRIRASQNPRHTGVIGRRWAQSPSAVYVKKGCNRFLIEGECDGENDETNNSSASLSVLLKFAKSGSSACVPIDVVAESKEMVDNLASEVQFDQDSIYKPFAICMIVSFLRTQSSSLISVNIAVILQTLSPISSKGGRKKTKARRGKNVEDEPQEPLAAGRWLPVEEVDLTGDVPGASQEDLFGHDARPRPSGKQRPAKKSKSDATASTGGSSASAQFGELMEQELRLEREAAERAFEAQAEKDRTLMRLEELSREGNYVSKIDFISNHDFYVILWMFHHLRLVWIYLRVSGSACSRLKTQKYDLGNTMLATRAVLENSAPLGEDERVNKRAKSVNRFRVKGLADLNLRILDLDVFADLGLMGFDVFADLRIVQMTARAHQYQGTVYDHQYKYCWTTMGYDNIDAYLLIYIPSTDKDDTIVHTTVRIPFIE
ncbi:hypothetical protein Tco_0511570 [Tanacetum coccineum]